MRLVDGEMGLDAQGKLADDTTKDLVYTEGDSPLLEGGGAHRGATWIGVPWLETDVGRPWNGRPNVSRPWKLRRVGGKVRRV